MVTFRVGVGAEGLTLFELEAAYSDNWIVQLYYDVRWYQLAAQHLYHQHIPTQYNVLMYVHV